MTECPVCGAAGFRFQCPHCGERFCRDHVDPAAHDCPEEGPDAAGPSLGRILSSFAILLAIVALLVAFLLALGPGGPLGGPAPTDVEEGTTADPDPERAVLQVVNEERDAANLTLLGGYGPLADLAADRTWTVPSDHPTRVDESVTCTSMAALEYRSDSGMGRRSAAEAAVSQWVGVSTSRDVLLDPAWELAGASVTDADDGVRVRVVFCDSTA